MQQLNVKFYVRCLLLKIIIALQYQWIQGMHPHVSHFDYLKYDTSNLHQQHTNLKFGSVGNVKHISLQFRSHARDFNLSLVRDNSVFSSDLVIEDSAGNKLDLDIAHTYHGNLHGRTGSIVYGSIISGIFRGVIEDPKQGTYYVEENTVFFGNLVNQSQNKFSHQGHSVMYHGDAVKLPKSRFGSTNFCGSLKSNLTNSHTFPKLLEHKKQVKINDSDTRNDRSNPYRLPYIGVGRFLNIFSLEDFSDYCLGFLFTNRDFDDGVLGLAWVGSTASIGGICEKSKVFTDKVRKSLNSGLVTFTNFGFVVPSPVTHITFAHELGHSLGSRHDSTDVCVPGDYGSSLGNYIMYARSTGGLLKNNRRFSPCSITSIGDLLKAKKDECFVSPGSPVCGNQLVDSGEECDCGFKDDCAKLGDNCCVPGDDMNVERRCKLKTGRQCSPSQGPCCTKKCNFASTSHRCIEEGECHPSVTCRFTGNSATCPPASDSSITGKRCQSRTKTCINGECMGSICLFFDHLEACTCRVDQETGSKEELCHSCCQLKNKKETCASTGSESMSRFFNTSTIFLQPGSACDNFKGYCDIFSNCRQVDTEGPLFRITTQLLNPEFYFGLLETMQRYWWAVALVAISLIVGLVFFIQKFDVHYVPKQDVSAGPYPMPGARGVLNAFDKALPKNVKRKLSVPQKPVRVIRHDVRKYSSGINEGDNFLSVIQESYGDDFLSITQDSTNESYSSTVPKQKEVERESKRVLPSRTSSLVSEDAIERTKTTEKTSIDERSRSDRRFDWLNNRPHKEYKEDVQKPASYIPDSLVESFKKSVNDSISTIQHIYRSESTIGSKTADLHYSRQRHPSVDYNQSEEKSDYIFKNYSSDGSLKNSQDSLEPFAKSSSFKPNRSPAYRNVEPRMKSFMDDSAHSIISRSTNVTPGAQSSQADSATVINPPGIFNLSGINPLSLMSAPGENHPTLSAPEVNRPRPHWNPRLRSRWPIPKEQSRTSQTAAGFKATSKTSVNSTLVDKPSGSEPLPK